MLELTRISPWQRGLGSFRELGFLASFVQLWAATIFWISTVCVSILSGILHTKVEPILYSTGLPGVIPGFPEDPSVAITDIFFWTPQVVGGSGFIISSLLLMLEVQTRWWKPNLTSMGWLVGRVRYHTSKADLSACAGISGSGTSSVRLGLRCVVPLGTLLRCQRKYVHTSITLRSRLSGAPFFRRITRASCQHSGAALHS